MSELRTVVPAMLLAAGVAAAVAAGAVRLTVDARPGMASVRLGELAAEHAGEAARADASPEETAAAVRAWAVALEESLADVSARHRAVLLPARAIAAGAPDLTDAVRVALAERLARDRAEARR